MPASGAKEETSEKRAISLGPNLLPALGPCMAQVNPEVVKAVVDETQVQVRNLPPNCMAIAADLVDKRQAHLIIVDRSTIEIPRANELEFDQMNRLIAAYESGLLHA